MIQTLRILTATSALITPIVIPHVEQPRPAIVTIDMSPSERETALRAVDLFDEAGLQLPPVVIRRFHDKAGCAGNDGLYRLDTGHGEVDICTTDGPAWQEHLIIHELAHAWSLRYLTPTHKAMFKQLRGWKYWLDYKHADWKDNGAEQAAEIIVWGLSDHAVPVMRIDHHSCAELRAGYVALTGLEPLHGHTGRCQVTSTDRRS